MRYRVVNAGTEEIWETDSLKLAFQIADHSFREWEHYSNLPWITAEISVFDFVKKDFVNFKTKYI